MAAGAHIDADSAIDVGRLRWMSAEIVRLLHIGIVVFTGIGWAFTSTDILWVHLLLVPVMKFHWITNGGICVLTSLELRLRGHPDAGTGEQPGFIFQLVSMVVSNPPHKDVVNLWMERAMWVGWLVTCVKLFAL